MAAERTNGIFTLGVIKAALDAYAAGTGSVESALGEIRGGLERMDKANEAGRPVWEERCDANS